MLRQETTTSVNPLEIQDNLGYSTRANPGEEAGGSDTGEEATPVRKRHQDPVGIIRIELPSCLAP
jgi:hypothetical protein